ncbi:MAG: MFS transporter [Chlamydiota bacterium]
MKQFESNFQKNISIFSILLLAFIDYFGIGLVYPLFSSMLFSSDLPFFDPEVSASVRGFYLGILLALQPLFQFFSAPILGTFSDQRGRKQLLIITLCIALAGYLIGFLAVYSYNLIGLLLSRIVVGISAGSTSIIQASLADISTKADKTKNFGLYNMALGTGFTIGPFLGGKLTDPNFIPFATFSTPFLITVLFVALNLLLVIFFYRETLKTKKKVELSIWVGLQSLQKIFKLKKIRILFLCTFVYIFGWSFFFEFMPVYLINVFNFTPQDIGNVFGVAGLSFALSSGIFIRPIVNRYKAQTILFFAPILMSIIIFSIALSKVVPVLYVLFCVTTFFAALILPSLTAAVSNFVEENVQGEVLGLLSSTIGLALAISPLFSGAIAGAYPIMPIVVGGGCMLLTSVVISLKKFS